MFGDIYSESTKERGIYIYAIEYLFERIKKEKNKKFKIIVCIS